MDETEVAFATADELAGGYRDGTLDPVEVTEVMLARIARLNGRLNAFIRVLDEEARAEATASRARWRAACPLGPLDGVPVAVKELADIAGWATSAGSAALRHREPAGTTATVVRRLRAAGAVILGKTHMVEFACGGWGTNAHLGTPWNPWDAARHRAPGGSSSGSAVAVAAGLATAAIGSDTGGSVRIPAALCGLTGLKTTEGRVSNAGVFPLSPTLDTLGPLARSVHDAAAVYQAIYGEDPEEPATWRIPPDRPMESLARPIAGMRLGALPQGERAGVASEVLAAYESALATLVGLGAVVVDADLPELFDEVRPRCGTVIMAEGYAMTRAWIERDDLPLDANVRSRLLSGGETSVAGYLDALADRKRTQRIWREALQHVDVVLTPTTPIAAPLVEEVDESAFTLARFTRAGNYLGWSAIAVPAGFDAAGLPLSLAINAPAFHESRALQVGAALQGVTDQHRQRAPLASLH